MYIPIYDCSLYRNKHLSDIVSKAELVGYFSVDSNRKYVPDSTRMRYYRPHPTGETVAFDLDKGVETAKRRDASFIDEGMVHLLEWIKLNQAKLEPPADSDNWIQPDFVCSRGLLTRLFCTRYARKNAWIIYAAKWKGTIYMRADKQEKLNYMTNRTESRMSSWGHKFEQYLVTDSPSKKPDPSKPVEETEEFRCVYKRRFGEHNVLYASEMDAVSSETELEDPLPLKDVKFIELKTARMIEHAGHEKSFRRFKISKWWCQGFLANVDKVVCGFRDDSGVVHRLKDYSLNNMYAIADSWDPKDCADFCASFLTQISKLVTSDCDETVYKFERLPDSTQIFMTHLSPSPKCDVIPSSYKDSILL